MMPLLRLLTLTLAGGLLVAGAAAVPASAGARHDHHDGRAVSVAGAVATPTTYTPETLAALAQTTLPDLRDPHHRGRTLTGTLLEPLVTTAGPVLPAVKNAALRVTVTVSGRGHDAVAVALAELAPNNGDHPALLVAERRASRVDLVFPGDRGGSRTIRGVTRIEVAVATPALPTGVPAGAVQVVDGDRTRVVDAARIAALPTVTRTVSFLSGQGPQTRVETGPTLGSVLRAAGVRVRPTTTVAAIATDGYVATVSPAEARAGRRVLLLSTVEDGVALAQPRLVTDGDVYGARYVTGVLGLAVSSSSGRC